MKPSYKKLATWISIAVSIAALALGCWNSWQIYRMNTEVNRPVLACDRAFVETSWSPNVIPVSGSDDVVINFYATVKNSGKETAILLPYQTKDFLPGLYNESEDCQILQVLDDSMKGGLEVISGTEVGMGTSFRVSHSCEKRRKLRLSLTFDAKYVGKINGTTYPPQPISCREVTVSPADERKKEKMAELPPGKYLTITPKLKWTSFPVY
jgi:hypothetical protein